MEYLNINDRPLIIWIDANVYNNENQNYLLQLGYNNINMNHSNAEMNYISQVDQNHQYDIKIFNI